MQELRSAIVNTLTYIAGKSSTDLTFAVASGRTDVGQDVKVYARRATMYRSVVGVTKS